LLDHSFGVGPYEVFRYNNVAGLRYPEVRLGCDDQSKRLQVRCHVQNAAFVSVEKDFTEIHWPSLRRNRPQNVGQILGAKPRSRLEVFEFGFDFDIALLTFDFRFAMRCGQQWRSAKIEPR